MADFDEDNPLASEGSAVKVCIRVRPFIKEEISGLRSDGKPLKLCVAMDTKTSCKLTRLKNDDEQFNIEDKDAIFEYDRCYWSHDTGHPLFADQELLYQEIGKWQLASAIEGYNNCLFAYGQTGSGKSFSVIGALEGNGRGLLPRIVAGLFEYCDEHPEVTFKCLVSFIEIYQEAIADLLIDEQELKRKAMTAMDPHKLKVREHPVHGVYIPGLTERPVTTAKEVLKLLEGGMEARHVAETAMNATSSRSHSIFSFKTSLSAQGSKQTKMSQMHLVDLAGSERARRTQATGDRLKEGASINQSLSTLAHVISELAKGKKSNPPFRNSKLTLILRESLSGNSKTVMMAAIAPSSADYAESLSTLKFAQSVKLISTKAKINQVHEGGIEEHLKTEIQGLQERLKQLEADKDTDAAKIVELTQAIEDSQSLYGSSQAMGSKWIDSLKQERERSRALAIADRIGSADMSALYDLSRQIEEEQEKREQARNDKERSSTISIVWDGVESSSDDSDEEVVKIRLKEMTLVNLKNGMKQLERVAADVTFAVNAIKEQTLPQVKLTPTLCITLDGEVANYVIKSERIKSILHEAKSEEDDEELGVGKVGEEWLSEAEFKHRHKALKNFFPEAEKFEAPRRGTGHYEMDPRLLAMRTRESRDKLAKNPLMKKMYQLAKGGVDVWSVTGLAPRIQSDSGEEKFSLPDIGLTKELTKSRAIVKALRGQLEHADRIIESLRGLKPLDWPPGSWKAGRNLKVLSDTTRFGLQIPHTRNIRVVRRKGRVCFGDDGFFGRLVGNSNMSTRKSVINRRDSEPTIGCSQMLEYLDDGSPNYCEDDLKTIEILRKEYIWFVDDPSYPDPPPLKSCSTIDLGNMHALVFEDELWEGSTDSSEDETFLAWKRSMELQRIVNSRPKKKITDPKVIKANVVGNLRTKYGRLHDKLGSPGPRFSKHKRESLDDALRGEPLRRTRGGDMVTSLAMKDPSVTAYHHALRGKDPSLTLFEALKSKKASDTVRNVLYPNPSITGKKGVEAVEATLEVLWKSGLVESTKPGRRTPTSMLKESNRASSAPIRRNGGGPAFGRRGRVKVPKSQGSISQVDFSSWPSPGTPRGNAFPSPSSSLRRSKSQTQ